MLPPPPPAPLLRVLLPLPVPVVLAVVNQEEPREEGFLPPLEGLAERKESLAKIKNIITVNKNNNVITVAIPQQEQQPRNAGGSATVSPYTAPPANGSGAPPEPAQILRRLKTRRIAFNEDCTTSFHSFFSIVEPHSTYFSVRRWVQERNANGFEMNRFAEFRRRTSVQRRSVGLSQDSNRMLHTPNAGGNSLWSEVMSLELLQGMYGASLLRLEMEILYGCHSKITDYSVVMMGHHLGVSVTRAMKFRGIFTTDDALYLLNKKLSGVVKSTRGVIRAHRWEKQILHVWAECDYIAELVQRVYEEELEDEMKANTMVICTVARDAGWMF